MHTMPYKLVDTMSQQSIVNSGDAELEVLVRSLQNAIAFTGHESMSKLTILRIAVEKLRREIDGPLTQGQLATIEVVEATISQMTHISQTYMDMARITEPELKVHQRFVNPMREIFSLLQTQYSDWLDAKQQTLTVKCSNPNLLVWADKSLLLSVCENLLSNAIKYGEQEGQIVIEITDRGAKDQISIWNSGQGVPKNQFDDIFDRFFVGDISVDGNGIGLYLARQIVEAHGGNLWVESQEDSWANLIFTLPKRGSCVSC